MPPDSRNACPGRLAAPRTSAEESTRSLGPRVDLRYRACGGGQIPHVEDTPAPFGPGQAAKKKRNTGGSQGLKGWVFPNGLVPF